MASINFTGLGSNIDFNLIRDSIVAAKMGPVLQLQQRGAVLTSRSDALKQLNGLLATLTNAAEGLTDRTLGSDRSASSSDASIVTATATTAASVGSFSLTVGRLATSLTQASTSLPSVSSPVLAGGAISATFELRMGGASSGTPITIDSTNNSLTGLRDAINNAHTGVTASIVDLAGDGTQNQLVLNSTATGASGRVELVETTSTGTLAALDLRSLNPPGAVGDFSTLDAQLTINGLTITRANNSISDAVSGITFNLKKAGSAAVAITQSSEIVSRLQTFVNAYNSVRDFVSDQYKKDSKGKPTGVLAGDPTLRLAERQLRDAISTSSTDNGGALTSLAELGIGRDSNDKLTLETTTLNNKLQSSLSDVQALLFGATSSSTGIFNAVHATYDQLSDSISGVVQTAITGYQTSIQTLNKSILDQTQRINALKDSLTRQFAVMDAAIGQINSQGTTLTAIMKSLQTKSDN